MTPGFHGVFFKTTYIYIYIYIYIYVPIYLQGSFKKFYASPRKKRIDEYLHYSNTLQLLKLEKLIWNFLVLLEVVVAITKNIQLCSFFLGEA